MAGCASDSKDISPFNRYEVRNVLPLMTVRYGGKVYAWANMYFSTLDRWLTTTINFVGTEDESVFQMKDSINSCVTVKHTIKDANRSVDKEDWLYGVTKIDVYGDGQLNGMKIKINMIVDYNINTADFTLPLPYSFNIGIHKGNFHLKNKIKLLPGSEVFIDSDAVVNIDNLTVTSSAWTDSITFTTNELIKVPYNKNVKNLPPAKLIVNGTLIATALGGTVTTTSNTAEITVTTPSCIIYEPKKGGKEGWLVKSFKVSEYHEDGTSLSLVYQNADGTTKTPVSITAGGTYNSSSGDWVSGALPQN